MKEIITKHKVVFSLIAILVIAYIFVSISDSIVTNVVPNASSTPTTTVSGGTKVNNPITNTGGSNTVSNPAPKPVTTTNTSLKMTVSKEANYDAYVQQLGVNKNKCNSIAEALYNKLYLGTLESVKYSGSYNEDTGGCYLEVTGQKRTYNSFGEVASTTQNFYFRNALTTNLLAECVREGDFSVSNQNIYKCTDKVTGKVISKTQYDNLLASYK